MSVSLCESKQRHISALLCTGPYLPPLLYSVVHMIHKIKTPFALPDSNARVVFRRAALRGIVLVLLLLLFCHTLCLIAADWSTEVRCFCSSCVRYFWREEVLQEHPSYSGLLHANFPQSSWSINNPPAHDQNSIPVLPPARRAIVTESGCLWMRLKEKKKNENNLEGFSAAAWNFPLWKGRILHKKTEKIVRSEATNPLQPHCPRGLWG